MMDDFEREHLFCISDGGTSPLSPLRGLAFIPGPAPVRGAKSSVGVGIGEVVEYPAEAIRSSLRACPFVKETTYGPRPAVSIFEWSAGERSVLIEVETPSNPVWPFWGGSPLEVRCTYADLLEVWLLLARHLPRIWLHNAQCTMFSPRAFVTEIALRALAPALDGAAGPGRDRALRERERYEALLGRFPPDPAPS